MSAFSRYVLSRIPSSRVFLIKAPRSAYVIGLQSTSSVQVVWVELYAMVIWSVKNGP